MAKVFDLSELYNLAFDIGMIDYKSLGSKVDAPRELIAYCIRYDLLDQLLVELKTIRPAIDWEIDEEYILVEEQWIGADKQMATMN